MKSRTCEHVAFLIYLLTFRFLFFLQSYRIFFSSASLNKSGCVCLSVYRTPSFHLSRLFVDLVSAPPDHHSNVGENSLHASWLVNVCGFLQHDKQFANIYCFHQRMLNHKWLWSNGYCDWIKNSLFAVKYAVWWCVWCATCHRKNWHLSYIYKTHLAV